MRYRFSHEIDNNPQEEEDVGILKVSAKIPGEYGPLTFSSNTFAKDFIKDVNDESILKEVLNDFLTDGGINDDDTMNAMFKLIDYVDEVTCSSEYTPESALYVSLDFNHEDDLGDQDDDLGDQEDDVDDDLFDQEDDPDDAQIDQVVQFSFDEPSNIRFRPASKHAVKSLTRKIFNKKIQKKNKKTKIYEQIGLEECTICLEQFSDGGRVVTLPCGHDFDDECMVKWLETSHICPLCRFELPCEDQES